jgi:F420-non-reducing hydrogenase large subunit
MNTGAPSEYLSFENPDFKPVFMSLQNKNAYDVYEGNLKLKNNGDILKEFTPDQYEEYIYREGAAGVYLDYEGEKTLMVGPIARYKIVKKYGDEDVDSYLDYFNKPWETNLLSANFLGLLELLFLSKKCVSMIETCDLTNPKGVPRDGISNRGVGIGAVEAPRGTLIHHYEVDHNNLIKRAKLYIPTEMNIPTMNKLLTTFCKKFYAETQDLELMKKYAQMIVRAFDPCISCATHVVNLRSK